MSKKITVFVLIALSVIFLSVFTVIIASADTLYGDANGDGKITSTDIVRLKKYFAEYDPDTGTSTVVIFPGADANGDGKVSSTDIVRLKKYFAEYDPDTGTSTVRLGPEEPDPDEGWSIDIR